MTTEIDEKVVEMRFENQQFEKGIQTSMSSLEKLKQRLNFKGSAGGFNELEKAARKCDLSSIGKSADSVKLKFSALEIMGVTALTNITNAAINTGKNLVKSLSVDQITSGWDKYAQKTASVQTIMNATGKSIDDVNGYLNKLMWFSDETSYGFTDMTSALGQLTSAGGDVDKLIPMIMGIANATAFAGKGTAEFSRSIYNLNQSYGAGALQYMDWRSLELAGVASEQLKRTFIETGEALGKIEKGEVTIANFASTLKEKWADTEVMERAFGSFAERTEEAYKMVQSGQVETASEAYEILSKKYNDIAMRAATAAQEAKTFNEAIDATKDAVSSGFMQSFEIIFGNYAEAKVLWTDLANALWDVFASGAEARNEMLTGAMTSGWSQFLKEGISNAVDFKETIYNTAVAHGVAMDEIVASSKTFEESLSQGWLTADILAESLQSITEKTSGLSEEELAALGYTQSAVDSLSELNGLLADGTIDLDSYSKSIGRLSGRENLIRAFWNTWNAFFADSDEQVGVLTALKRAMRDIFPETTSEKLYAITEAIRELTEKFKMSEETADKLQRSFRGVFAVADILVTFIKSGFRAGFDLVKALLGETDMSLLDLTASLGDSLVSLRDWIKQGQVFGQVFYTISYGIRFAIVFVREFIKELAKLPQVKSAADKLKNTFSGSGNFFEKAGNLISSFLVRVRQLNGVSFKNIAKAFTDFRTNVLGKLFTLPKPLENVKSGMETFINGVSRMFARIVSFATGSQSEVSNAFEAIVQLFVRTKDRFLDTALKLRNGITGKIGFGEMFAIGIATSLTVFVKKISNALELLAAPFAGLEKVFNGLGSYLKAAGTKMRLEAVTNMMKTVAQSVLMLAAAMAALAIIDIKYHDNLVNAGKLLAAVAGGFIIFSAGFTALMGVLGKKLGATVEMTKLTVTLAAFGAGVLLLSKALTELRGFSIEESADSLVAVGTLMTALFAVMIALSKQDKKISGGVTAIIGFALGIKLLVGVLKDIDQAPLDSSKETITSFAALFGALVAVVLVAKQIGPGAGASLLAAIAGIDLLMLSMSQLGKLKFGAIKRTLSSVITILGSFALLLAASKLAGQNAAKGGLMLIEAAGAMTLLTAAVAVLGHLDGSVLKKGLESIAALSLCFAALIAVTGLAKNADKLGVTLVGMTAVILALTGAIAAIAVLAKRDPESLDEAAAIVRSLMLMLVLLVAATEKANGASKAILSLGLVITALASILYAMHAMEIQNALENAEALAVLLVSLTAALKLLSKTKAPSEGALRAISSLVLVTGGLSAILAFMSDVQKHSGISSSLETAASLSILLLAMAAATKLLSQTGPVYKSALIAMLIMEGFITLLAGILGVMAKLDVRPSIETAASLSLMLVAMSYAAKLLTEGDGSFKAGLVGVGTLLLLILGLGAVMLGITQLREKFPTLPEDLDYAIQVLEKIGTGLGAAVGGVVGGTVGSLFAGIGKIGDYLGQFAEGAAPFFDGLSGTSGNIGELAKLLDTLVTAAAILPPNSGDILEDFGEQLIPFGDSLQTFASTMDGFNADDVTSVACAAQALSAFARNVPNTGGKLAEWMGDNRLEDFGEQLKQFGPKLMEFASSVKGLDGESVTAAAKAGEVLAAMAVEIPNSGGLLADIIGDNDAGEFGSSLVKFGKKIVKFAEVVNGLDTGSVDSAAAAAGIMVALARDIPNSGGLLSLLTGDNDIAAFGNKLGQFGEGLYNFDDWVENLNYDSMSRATTFLQDLVSALTRMTWNNGNYSDVYTFFESIQLIPGYMVSFDEVLSKIDSPKFLSEVFAAFGGLADFAREIWGLSPNDNLSRLFEDLSKLNVQDYLDGVEQDIPSAEEVGRKLGESMKTGIEQATKGFYTIGVNAVRGFLNGAKSQLPDVATVGENIGKKILNTTAQTLDIHSPSKKMEKLGKHAGLGFAKGLKETEGDVEDASSGWLDGAIDAGKSVWSALTGAASSAKDAVGDFVKPIVEPYKNDLVESLTGVKDELIGSVEASLGGDGGLLNNWLGKPDETTSQIEDQVNSLYNTVSSGAKNSSGAVKAAAKTAFESFEDYIDEERFYNRISTEEQLAQYQNVLDTYALTADERKKVCREIYTLENQLRKENYQNAMDWIEEEKYYDRLSLSDELKRLKEEQVKYAEGSEDRKKLDREVYRVEKEEKKAAYDASMDWIEREKYYKRLSLEEELAAYQRVQARYEWTSEEYQKMSREIYRVQNELVQESYDNLMDRIEEEQFYGRLTKEQELAMLEAELDKYKEGSEQRIALEKKVYTAKKEAMKEAYEFSLNWIEKEKYYDRMGLADELAAYLRVQSRYAKGTEEREKMDREVYRLQKEIYSVQKEYLADVQAEEGDAAKKRLELEEEYAEKTAALRKQLADDIEAENKRYLDAIDSRANALYKSYGLFDEVKEKEEVSGTQLIANLEDQVKEFSEWEDLLGSLSARGVSSELLEELQEMGPSSIAQIRALSSMSDTELDKYVSLWSVKHGQARAKATQELEGLRAETLTNIATLRTEADQKLEEYHKTWVADMERVNADSAKKLEELKKAYQQKLGLLAPVAQEEFDEMVAAAQEVLAEAGWNDAGQKIVEEIADGLAEKEPSFLEKCAAMAKAGAARIKEILGDALKFNDEASPLLGNTTALKTFSNRVGTTGATRSGSVSEVVLLDKMPSTIPVGSSSVSSFKEIQTLKNDWSTFLASNSMRLAARASDGIVPEQDQQIQQVDNRAVVKELQSLRNDINKGFATQQTGKVVLDSGALVGALVSPMDKALGRQAVYAGRGI